VSLCVIHNPFRKGIKKKGRRLGPLQPTNRSVYFLLFCYLLQLRPSFAASFLASASVFEAAQVAVYCTVFPSFFPSRQSSRSHLSLCSHLRFCDRLHSSRIRDLDFFARRPFRVGLATSPLDGRGLFISCLSIFSRCFYFVAGRLKRNCS
jgi:hypothetical protein